MREEWRPVVGYEGLYEVSNMGRVKSLERTVWDSVRGYYRTIKERILKPGKDNDGYLHVILYKDGIKKSYTVHQLVGNAFLSNPQGYKELNHRDEDKTNNCVENLEYCSRSYNCNYGTRNQKLRGRKLSEEHIKKLSKPVIAIDVRTGLIVEFGSAHEAERKLGINNGNIIQCCKGKYKSMGGFYWYYADTE